MNVLYSIALHVFVVLSFLVQCLAAYKEMIDWEKMSHDLLAFDAGEAARSYPLAVNQGLYNLFLAAGIALPYVGIVREPDAGTVQLFALFCMVIAGVFGFFTVKHPTDPSLEKSRAFIIQAAVPAIALLLILA